MQVTDNIWGYLWGKQAYGVMLFATALTNDSIHIAKTPDLLFLLE